MISQPNKSLARKRGSRERGKEELLPNRARRVCLGERKGLELASDHRCRRFLEDQFTNWKAEDLTDTELIQNVLDYIHTYKNL